ncbi:MAG: hypothetical protein ACYDG5_08805, partial [Dehalococcoidales bacterium]
TWCYYIRSGFNSTLRKEFCFRYFVLLDVIISNFLKTNADHSWVDALQTTLGFECFGITNSSNDEVLGAGTCTLRNPCYLLAKLKMPKAPDDPQFLPIVTVAGTKKQELFYHYRQYTLSKDSPASLMLYPAVSEEKRSTSFRLINSLAGGVSYGIDPRTRERAKRLYQKIIRPALETDQLSDTESLWLEIVDVGAGSGGLTSAICRQFNDAGFKLKFRLWFVDLETANPARFFCDRKSRSVVDSLQYLGDDYRSWLSEEKPLPAAVGLRIALISRLFNNLSLFSIQHFKGKELNSLTGKMAIFPDSNDHLPHHCLAPGDKGVDALVISNTRLVLVDGRTFAQASLSDFYRGLYLVLRREGSVDASEEGLFLPVRSFSLDCLNASGGGSVISCLAGICDYVVIEDADLRRQDLVEHMKNYSLNSVTIQDMTKALSLTGNHAYIIYPKSEYKKELNLGGERLW